MPRIPPWIRLRMNAESEFAHVHNLMGDLGLHTVCKSAKCPNIHECWGRGTATMMLLGNLCTRACRFCAVPAGRPRGLDLDEPRRVAEAARRMNLRHVVLTSVARDDLPDGGAGIFAETILAIRRELPGATIEVLTPDFQGNFDSLNLVLDAKPDVFNHNLETVKRLQAAIRPQASYGRSLSVLRAAARRPEPPVVKSGLMVGLGETDEEITEAMRDLYEAGVRLLTVGQYLQPTRAHRPVARYVEPERFAAYEREARAMGFLGVASGPMVRSSYKAEELLKAAREAASLAAP
ncbi:MAG: lipoyl synthase [Kiritimatiellae bacterium]|nr:lipoyl synthase [Kiritimatiellia bacterium]MDW8458415.1 lipoyl synthase [Verrucomicrobiota bacterium]